MLEIVADFVLDSTSESCGSAGEKTEISCSRGMHLLPGTLTEFRYLRTQRKHLGVLTSKPVKLRAMNPAFPWKEVCHDESTSIGFRKTGKSQ
jgi:hypothetical protein